MMERDIDGLILPIFQNPFLQPLTSAEINDPAFIQVNLIRKKLFLLFFISYVITLKIQHWMQLHLLISIMVFMKILPMISVVYFLILSVNVLNAKN
jgi:hypothetical protein